MLKAKLVEKKTLDVVDYHDASCPCKRLRAHCCHSDMQSAFVAKAPFPFAARHAMKINLFLNRSENVLNTTVSSAFRLSNNAGIETADPASLPRNLASRS